MKGIFWSAVAFTAYTYAGYPIVIWVLSRVRGKPWHRSVITPPISVVMAVHNGAALLESKLHHLFTLDYANIADVVVVSDGSTDGTNEILLGERNLRLKSVVCDDQVGKAEAINRAVPLARGELILFVDIRPWIAPGAVSNLVSNFADPKVGCAAGDLTLREAGHDPSTAAVGGLYWRYEQWIRDCEAQFDSPLGVYGGFYAIRRSVFTPFPAGTILDDMFEPLSIIRLGYRSVIDLSARVKDTWPSAAANEFHRKVRTLAGNYQLVQLAPWLVTPINRVWLQLISHKLMRLVVPFLLPIMFATALVMARQSTFYFWVAVLQIVFYLAALIGGMKRLHPLSRLTGAAHAFCMLNLAAAVGLYKFLFTRGPLWKIWGKPQITSAAKLTRKAAATD